MPADTRRPTRHRVCPFAREPPFSGQPRRQVIAIARAASDGLVRRQEFLAAVPTAGADAHRLATVDDARQVERRHRLDTQRRDVESDDAGQDAAEVAAPGPLAVDGDVRAGNGAPRTQAPRAQPPLNRRRDSGEASRRNDGANGHMRARGRA